MPVFCGGMLSSACLGIFKGIFRCLSKILQLLGILKESCQFGYFEVTPSSTWQGLCNPGWNILSRHGPLNQRPTTTWLHVVLALQRRSDLCIPRNETARPRSQFLHSCICERLTYSHERGLPILLFVLNFRYSVFAVRFKPTPGLWRDRVLPYLDLIWLVESATEIDISRGLG
jgi:hypothetical protein